MTCYNPSIDCEALQKYGKIINPVQRTIPPGDICLYWIGMDIYISAMPGLYTGREVI